MAKRKRMAWSKPIYLAMVAWFIADCACKPSAACVETCARENDIVVATSPFTPGTGVAIYSPTGTLRTKMSTTLDTGYGGAALGISGNAKFAFVGSSSNADSGQLAIVRIAGGKPKFLGLFFGGNDLVLDEPNSMTTGHVSPTDDGYVFAAQSAEGSCGNSNQKARATRIIQLRFAPATPERNASLFRETSFEVVRPVETSGFCSGIVGIRTLGNALYAVTEEKEGVYVLRSYNAFDRNITGSGPIVTYSKSKLYSVTIDSPTSFIASGVQPGSNPGQSYNPVLLRIGADEELVISPPPPGVLKSESPLFLSGGLSSFVSGNFMGVIAPVGPFSEVPNESSGGCRQRVFRFDPKTLRYDENLICLKFKQFLLDLQIVPAPRQL